MLILGPHQVPLRLCRALLRGCRRSLRSLYLEVGFTKLSIMGCLLLGYTPHFVPNFGFPGFKSHAMYEN